MNSTCSLHVDYLWPCPGRRGTWPERAEELGWSPGPTEPQPSSLHIAFLPFQARTLTGAGATGREGQAHRILPGWSSMPRVGEGRHRESQPDTTVGKRGGPGGLVTQRGSAHQAGACRPASQRRWGRRGRGCGEGLGSERTRCAEEQRQG